MSAGECVRLGIDDSGRELTLRVGDAVCIDLPENPTTGFRWRAAVSDVDVVTLDEDRFEVTNANQGSRGVRHFRFVAAGAGIARIDMAHRRSWDTESEPEYTLRVGVR